MAPDELAHHAGLARRAERRADFLGLLHLDQPVDDVAARHQEAVDLLVDRVDLLAQFLQGGRGRGCFDGALDISGKPWCRTARCGRQTVALIRKDGR